MRTLGAPLTGSRRRLQIELSSRAFELLQGLVRETEETSLVGVIRAALRVYAWAMSEQKAGQAVVALDEGDLPKLECVVRVLSPLIEK